MTGSPTRLEHEGSPLHLSRSLDEVVFDPSDSRKQSTACWFADRFIDGETAREAWLKLVVTCYRAEGSLKTWEAAENEAIVWLAVEKGIR